MKLINPFEYIAKKFGRLTITEVGPPRAGGRYCLAICDCGVTKKYNLNHLKRGDTLSCGCLQKEKAKASNTKHGLRNHSLYGIWENMKSRCYNPKSTHYDRYGGRGISICKEWLQDFESFYNWCIANGWAEGLEIDRKQNDGNYEPGNCRCITSKNNCRNKSNNVMVTHDGETKCLIDWCEQLNLNYDKTHNRITKGWDIDKALTS